MKWLVGVSGVFVVGIYVAAMVTHAGAVLATEQLFYILSAAALGALAALGLQ